MKVVDSQTVNERMQELQRAAKILEKYAAPIYSITDGDPSFDQIWQIYSAPDKLKAAEIATKILAEVGEKQGKRLTISEEQKRKYRGIVVNAIGKLYRRHARPEFFTIAKGQVRVVEKARKMLEQEYTREVADEYATMNSWAATFVSVINNCPEPGVKRRLGRFALALGHELIGAKVETGKDGNLTIVDATG